MDNKNNVDKYFPEKIEDLIINPIKINILINWLDNYNLNANKYKNLKKKIKITNDNDNDDDIINDNSLSLKNNKKNISHDKNSLIVFGSHGIGKSSFVRTVLKEKKYNIIDINFEIINRLKDINEYIEKLLKGINIFDMINNNYNLKRVILIDNIEIISSTTEKLFITQLIKYNQIGWYCPIIFISSNKHNKIINLIKKTSFEIELFSPTIPDLTLLLYKIAEKENLQFTDENVCNYILNQTNRDIRTLIEHLISLSKIYKKKVITNNDITDYFSTNKLKES